MATKTSSDKAPAKRTTAARKATTAARSATARAKRTAEAEALEGAVLDAPPADEPAEDEAGAGESWESDHADLEVTPGLSFTSTRKDRAAEHVGEVRVFEVDGEKYIARRPVDDAFVLLTTAAAKTTPMAERIAAILEFLGEVVDEADQVRLRNRLKDPADDFGFLDLFDVLEKVVATFSKNKGPQQARAMARPRR